jgi:16S rRNA (guanine527-N7)-methyltransferase
VIVGGEAAPELIAVLEDAQRLGFLGSRPIPEVIDHARGFVRALEQRQPIGTVLDLGSGGGVPGLVIAHDLPDVHVTLLDRRAKRTDALQRYVRRLGWHDRVTVVCQDVSTYHGVFDAVVARGFGPPEFTLTSGARLVRSGHPIVISEPPGIDRWPAELLEQLGLRMVARVGAHDDHRPAPAADGAGAPPPLDGLVAVFLAES